MSKRTLKFTQTIGYKHEDETFDTMEQLVHRTDLIEKDLSLLSGVTCTHTRVTRNHFPAPIDGYDLRVTFYVNKANRRVTWDDIYEVVNKINSVYYSFI